MLCVVTDELSSVFEHTEGQNLTLKRTKNLKNCNPSATQLNAILTLAAPVTGAYSVESPYIYSYLVLIVIFGSICLMVCLTL